VDVKEGDDRGAGVQVWVKPLNSCLKLTPYLPPHLLQQELQWLLLLASSRVTIPTQSAEYQGVQLL
jgi:hypothetical protein